MSVEQVFFVTVSQGQYLINGESAPTVDLISGKTYQFDLSDPSVSSHPFWFGYQGSPIDESLVYTTGQLGVDQVLTYTAPGASSGEFTYYCQNHSGMGGDFEVVRNVITGTEDGDELNGSTGDDNITGGGGDDSLFSGKGNDIIFGGPGNDTLDNGSGDDFVYGEAGDDTLINWSGTDYYDGGGGIDTIVTDLSDARIEGIIQPQSFEIYLNLKDEIHGLPEWTTAPDTVKNVENYTLIGDFDAELIGDAESNIFITDIGDDILRGEEGDDTLSAWIGNDKVYGGAGNDTIINTGGEDLFDGGDGIDTLITELSQSVKDRLGLNLDFDIVFDLTAQDPHMRHYAVKTDGTSYAWDEIYGIENYTLIGDFDASLTGDDKNNILITDSGNDELYGGFGNDKLDSGSGNDKLYGGSDFDTYVYKFEDGHDIIVDDGENLLHLISRTATGARLFGEMCIDDQGRLVIEGNKATAAAGSKLVATGITELYWTADDNSFTPTSQTIFNADVHQLSDVQSFAFIGTQEANTIITNTTDAHTDVYTGDGDDIITISGSGKSFVASGGGSDEVHGGTGNDIIFGDGVNNWQAMDNAGDDRLMGHDGNDELSGGLGNDTLNGGDGDDTLNGGPGNDILYGGDGDDEIYGGDGNDIIDDGLGSDTVDAGDGIDTYTRAFNDDSWIPHVDILNEGLFSPTFPGIKGDTFISFENVELKSTVDVIITGSDIDNSLKSGSGNDKIDGGAGNDTLNGGAGNDTLSGGLGSDKFIFDVGFGNDIITDFTHGVDELKFYDANGNLLTSTDVSETQNEDGDAVLTVSDGSSVTLTGVSVYSLPFNIVSQKSGDTVAFSFYLDPNQDPGDTGVGSFNATLGFEPNNLTYVSSSFADGLEGVPNATAVDSGTLGLGGFGLTPVTDLDTALFSVTFEANVAIEPVQLTLSDVEVDATSLSGGTYTIDLTGTTLSGSVFTRSGAALPEVVLEADTGLSTRTSSTGTFELDLSGSEQLLSGSLSFSNTGSTKTISAADALDALKLSVGLPTDAGLNDAFSLISADFDQNGRVTASDALEILKNSVGLATEQSPQFVFLDTNADYSSVDKASTHYTEGVNIADISADTSISLTGILIGDVNDSYSGLIA
jgi:Ca2+-binding RTX toxin-like protein